MEGTTYYNAHHVNHELRLGKNFFQFSRFLRGFATAVATVATNPKKERPFGSTQGRLRASLAYSRNRDAVCSGSGAGCRICRMYSFQPSRTG